MDHDADHTHLNKLRIFRDDFLVLSGLSMDQFHEMAEQRRAGKPVGDIVPRADAPAHRDDVLSPEQAKDLTDHVVEISEALTAVQQRQEAAADALAWMNEHRTAIEGLLAGSAATAHEIVDHEGTEAAQNDEKAPAAAPAAEGMVAGDPLAAGQQTKG